MFSFLIRPIGHAIPYFNLGDSSSTATASHDLNYFRWLDFQLSSSVLYISLGSVLSVSRARTKELAAVLLVSGVRFLWVALGETTQLREMCGEMGLVVPWCDQLTVLSHSSVGGPDALWVELHCWRHFLWAALSVFSCGIDQVSNSKADVEDWKIGWRVKREEGVETLVTREEIVELVRRFMDLESEEGWKWGEEQEKYRRFVNELLPKVNPAKPAWMLLLET